MGDELDDLDGLTDDELDRRLDQLAERHPPPRLLPPDLSALFGAIRNVASLRAVWSPDAPPHPFDRFEAFDCVIGGMGLVIEARDPQLDRKVAIKLWKQSGAEAQRALLAEAKTLAKLSHPNVVTVHETGQWHERVFFVMEWIDGVDGQAWMKQPRSWQDVRRVFVAAGRGLAAAHDTGIQHRDFKPANMLIGNNGRVVVADFGIADSLRTVDNADPRWGTPVGTPAYMAPERLRGGPGDARSDQFSFCAAMWRGLHGQRPYAGETAEQLLASIERGELRDDPDAAVPRWLDAVVRKGLAADPDARHRDMHELVQALLDEPSKRGRGPSRMWFLVAMAVAFGAVLGVEGARVVGRAGAGEHVEVAEPEPIEPEPTEPCAGVEPGQEVNPVVHEVCRLIRDDHFRAADMLWEREYDRRAADVPDEALVEDAIIVATTFIHQAEALDTKDPSRARVAAQIAFAWALKAATNLGQDEPRVEDIEARAQQIIAGPAQRR